MSTEENLFIKILTQHWKKIFYIVLVFGILAVFIDRLKNQHHHAAKNDFLLAKRTISSFNDGHPIDIDSFQQLQQIALRHPELHPMLDSLFAFTLVEQDKTDEAANYAMASFERIASYLPSCYQDFTKASTLIHEKRYLEALSLADHLDRHFQKNSQGFEKLQAFNLLRIVFLTNQIGDDEKAKQAWNRLKQHPQYSAIEAIFSKGECTLKNYFICENIDLMLQTS